MLFIVVVGEFVAPSATLIILLTCAPDKACISPVPLATLPNTWLAVMFSIFSNVTLSSGILAVVIALSAI